MPKPVQLLRPTGNFRGRVAPTAQEVKAACKQALRQLGEGARQAEIAFFGGSFTAIDPAYQRELLEAAFSFVGPQGFGGIRLSTRPDAIDRDILSMLKSYGVTAVELGAQSMDDRVLEMNRRGHNAQAVGMPPGSSGKLGWSWAFK